RLLPPDRLAEAAAVSSSGVDEVFGMPTTWGLGYGLGGPDPTDQSARTEFGYGGVGGSFACGDTASGTAWAVTKKRVSNDFPPAVPLGQLIAGPPWRGPPRAPPRRAPEREGSRQPGGVLGAVHTPGRRGRASGLDATLVSRRFDAAARRRPVPGAGGARQGRAPERGLRAARRAGRVRRGDL